MSISVSIGEHDDVKTSRLAATRQIPPLSFPKRLPLEGRAALASSVSPASCFRLSVHRLRVRGPDLTALLRITHHQSPAPAGGTEPSIGPSRRSRPPSVSPERQLIGRRRTPPRGPGSRLTGRADCGRGPIGWLARVAGAFRISDWLSISVGGDSESAD